MDLQELRKQIDGIDSKILELFQQRMDISKLVAEYKKQHGLPILNEGREDEVIQRAVDACKEEYRNGAKVLFIDLMDISKSLQQKELLQGNFVTEAVEGAESLAESKKEAPVVGCQGVEGAYSEIACDVLYPNAHKKFYKEWEDVFEAVQNGDVDYGVLPLENSTAGTVGENYELLRQYSLYIGRSVKIKANHCLVAKPGVAIEDIKKVYSHKQALDQCTHFTKSHGFETCEYVNTAAAAKFVASGSENFGAICSKKSAALYGLQILEENIVNEAENYTRFISISKSIEQSPQADTISVSLSIPHSAGSLYRLLTKFYVNGVNLTKIESKPLHTKNFDVIFYLDFSGNIADKNVVSLLNELSYNTNNFQFLGNFYSSE